MQLAELGQNGKIITVEIREKFIKKFHPSVEYLTGSSTDLKIIQKIKDKITEEDIVMVILDSDHDEEHVYDELVKYHSFVSKNNYLIVEDTFWIHDNSRTGPKDAVHRFLKDYPDLFEIDKSREKFLITYNPDGFLLKK